MYTRSTHQATHTRARTQKLHGNEHTTEVMHTTDRAAIHYGLDSPRYEPQWE